MNASDKPTRRDLLATTARAACVTALVAGAALLAWRNGRLAVCRKRTACGSCDLRDRCDDAAESEPRSR